LGNNYGMDKKLCKICNRIFTREWNLQRHLKDIHKIDNCTQDRIENPANFISKSPPFHQNINRYGYSVY
jgi:hypothetical protein